jgi:phage shock protein C
MDGGQLTRSRTNRRIAGVAGGIAEYFDVDPTLVRVGFVVATLLGLAGPLAYVVLWIALPEARSTAPVGVWSRGSTALRIAEGRFARGEISAEEFSLLRQDLAEGH